VALTGGPTDGPTVAEVGEDAFVAAVVDRLRVAAGTSTAPARVILGPGDDAAVMALDGPLVTSTDTLVQDVDFRLDWSSGYDVGRKAAVQVLADVEAMGAVPVGIVLALVVPGSTPLAWCLDLADGLAREARLAGAAVLGGDVADGGALVLTGTSFGVLVGERPAVRRDGAGPGDVVVLGPAGAPLGSSAAGLAVLRAGPAGPAGCDGSNGSAVDAMHRVAAVHRAPQVDHTAGARAREAGATAMIDVSDGLVRDATRMARASGVVLALDAAALAPSEDLVAVARLLGEDPQEWVLTSGEEHAMLAAFPAFPAVAAFPALPAVAALPGGFVPVGRVEAADDGWTGVTVDGLRRTDDGGWVHYPH